MKPISADEARALGIDTMHHQMDNGERRFRMVSSDGSSYIRTEASGASGWQNSHYHQDVTELYVVQSGWLVYAKLSVNGELTLQHMTQGDALIVKPLTHHNIYMSAFTVTHVVKYGGGSVKTDWFPSPELDKLTKHISESELVRRNHDV
ncbi:hypothetical protein ACFQI7_03665 [Paenibacillus allorhizosphaerae]|uniref:Cupin domain-containing protein n=1 Tax=Paenibacillus allorhizosphaerae TaxID=2849866 RepID=A0ABM8VCQ3_9BACL|nr:hypothetical protein [Paenibacillus allorhizosphaerae]CAG7624730.1 hypothetical protein PAECIP111802_01094 [Paenibacillus allorhizosphaerae]